MTKIRASANAVRAMVADLASWRIEGVYDTVVAIGILLFFPRATALRLLSEIREHTNPGGCVIVNALIDGTTYMEMFGPGGYCLFGPREIEEQFPDWRVVLTRRDTFPAPDDTRKEFSTVVAQRPAP